MAVAASHAFPAARSFALPVQTSSRSQGGENLLGRVGGQAVELDVLGLGLALVAGGELPGVARQGVHVVQPPVRRA